jgi:polyhydroxybutyrate depolymerase
LPICCRPPGVSLIRRDLNVVRVSEGVTFGQRKGCSNWVTAITITDKASPGVLTFLAAATAIFASATRDNVGPEPKGARGSLMWGGIQRTYLVHTPGKDPGNRPLPLVLVLHGGGGTAEGMVKLTRGRFNELADRDSFIVVYPDGVEKHWNDGRSIQNWRAHKDKIDDVGFLSLLISDISVKWKVDPSRIYATGISNGGLMTYRLACELTDKIAGIASVSASLSVDLYPVCSPKRPVSVMVINGTDDPLVPYDGGTVGFGLRTLGKVVSTDETVRFWVKRNGCREKPEVVRVPDRDSEDRTTLRKEIYGGCAAKTSVALYVVEGGGHSWPGGWQYLPQLIVGRTSREFNAADEIWGFFKSHPRTS